MARKKYLKTNVTFNSIEEWECAYTNLKRKLEKTGLTYKPEYDREPWFRVQLYTRKLYGGLSSLCLGLDNIDEKVRKIMVRYYNPEITMKVLIDLDKWKEVQD